ncbi:MAG: NUDIX domain-containing protein [Euryarchaeota archaeon]|nr:NUDIX domain-containing protein [Euryarchaeota archaeon]
MKESSVVTCVIRHGCKILILKRSDKVSTNKLKWAGVSGYIEKGETPLETAYKEMAEEVRQNDPKLVKIMPVMTIRSDEHIWHIHPFLFDTEQLDIVIDWEHTDFKWVGMDEIGSYDLVPGFKTLLSDLEL